VPPVRRRALRVPPCSRSPPRRLRELGETSSGAFGSRSGLDATIAPHTRPATLIGTPTLERMPLRRTASAISPSSSA
jgi:hypothetical protein